MKVILKSAFTLKSALKPMLLLGVLGAVALIKIEGKFPLIPFAIILLVNITTLIVYFSRRVVATAQNNLLVVKGYFKTITFPIASIEMVKIEMDFMCRLHDIRKLVFTVNNKKVGIYTANFNLSDFEAFFRNAMPDFLPYRKTGDTILN